MSDDFPIHAQDSQRERIGEDPPAFENLVSCAMSGGR
jgi:hypothetical protein